MESREEVETRMAEGMYGGALPNGWGVTEADAGGGGSDKCRTRGFVGRG